MLSPLLCFPLKKILVASQNVDRGRITSAFSLIRGWHGSFSCHLPQSCARRLTPRLIPFRPGADALNELPAVYMARHGATEWTVAGRHTGLTDLPLIESGESDARLLGERLKGLSFAKVLTSPLQRAARTCELSGFGAMSEIDHDLVEWDYGEYEGLRTAEIRIKRPDWELFRDGCPGGESPQQAAARADPHC